MRVHPCALRQHILPLLWLCVYRGILWRCSCLTSYFWTSRPVHELESVNAAVSLNFCQGRSLDKPRGCLAIGSLRFPHGATVDAARYSEISEHSSGDTNERREPGLGYSSTWSAETTSCIAPVIDIPRSVQTNRIPDGMMVGNVDHSAPSDHALTVAMDDVTCTAWAMCQVVVPANWTSLSTCLQWYLWQMKQ